ncbi:PP2C family serine/threonine-protein phosphatase [Mycolicibacterium vinylchloridicum]|uniref:PP2C family serine/threonine-protein phosphatase n=1 Tax=Mycolicibacterium vinylchloridicum TaxID=2736928 RepID=UPI0015CC0E4D|nr:PP2C family serine/threonine-protein phosphatase [Mycolicibacterium vinylchloridicum]
MTDSPRDRSEPGYWQWAACGASATGSEHLRRGLGCDDAFGYGTTDDFVIAVVADGAGSVTGTSAWGSYAACQSVLHQTMTHSFMSSFRSAGLEDADAMMRWLFEGALGGVTRQAGAIGVPLSQLATTLCVAVSTPTLTVFGQIGDGVIASESQRGIETHLIEEKTEYANATWFVQTDGAFEESFRTSAHTDLTAFALSTDGMSYKITNIVTGKAYEPFFAGSWQHVRTGASAADFAALLRGIEDDQTGDDKTMVLAALRWADDEFHPSARPVQTTIVSSAPPSNASAGQPHNGASAVVSQPEPPTPGPPISTESHSIVDHGSFVDAERHGGDTALPPADIDFGDADTEPVGASLRKEPRRRWSARRRHD